MRNGLAPPNWGEAAPDASNEMIYRLETGFPWLRFCENHWKAKRVATNSYLQWYPVALARYNEERAKAQQGISDDDELPRQKRPLKRRVVEDDGARPSKRPHLEEGPSSAELSTNRQRVCRE